MRVQTMIAAVWLSFALAIVGCTADPVPKEPAPASTTAATATPPPMLDGAKEASKKGAVVFVKHYIDLLNYAANTGNVAPLKAASDPKCDGCNSYIEYYNEVYRNGDKITGIDWQPRKAVIESSKSNFAIAIDVDARNSEGMDEVYHLYFETNRNVNSVLTLERQSR